MMSLFFVRIATGYYIIESNTILIGFSENSFVDVTANTIILNLAVRAGDVIVITF